ncbi:MAG: 3-deoxy-manno-octulosonate cytidylyltransferase [Candidatus Melainabacteria bacterium]
MTHVLAVIPARYASTRFPGKPLALIDGRPMIQHVWERVNQAEGIDAVVVATDDPRIEEAVLTFGGTVRMTDPTHPSGTDRIWEVAQSVPEASLVLNVQGDEPHIDPLMLGELVAAMQARPAADILTVVRPIATRGEWENPNLVKAALAVSGQVLYFSRAAIPCVRDGLAGDDLPAGLWGHLGVYLYRREALARFTTLPPSPLEQLEKLEQLRAMEAGMRIEAIITAEAPVGVDTPEDLTRLTTGR